MKVNITFRNEAQESFFWHRERNGLFDGGFNNGKTFVGCQRAFIHLSTFSNYGMVIARQKYKVLKATTMKTFFKICPNDFIFSHNHQDGYTVFVNGSFIYWMHLDDVDEQDVRGLEINSGLLDQGEELQEGIYNVFDARIGRWDKAKVPVWLLITQLEDNDLDNYYKIQKDIGEAEASKFAEKNTKWPRHYRWGHFLVPNYLDVLCNPSDEDEFHWTYRYYNPASLERKPNHFYIHRESDKDLTDAHTYEQMLTRDPEWIERYVKGLTGSPKALIHVVPNECIIDPEQVIATEGEVAWKQFLLLIQNKAALYRILDHGETGVTACGWAGSLNKIHIFYREYYVSSTLISVNRQNIFDFSKGPSGELEEYVMDIADPAIFKKTTQKVDNLRAGFWSVANEYMDETEIEAPPILWNPADNNEMATRNRINELLAPHERWMHPITKISPAPGIYFIKRCKVYPYGCLEIIQQTKNQKKTLLGDVNGRKIYSDERDPERIDHAYDLVRYYVSQHNSSKLEAKRKPPKRSFAYFEMLRQRAKKIGLQS